MTSYPNINFSVFSVIEICDFVVKRVHSDIQKTFESLNETFTDNKELFKEADENQVIYVLLVRLKDECDQLMRLESKIFIPFLKSKINESGFQPPVNAVNKIYKYQETILEIFNKIKLNTKNFLSVKGFNSSEQIIINDFMTLNHFLNDWIFIMRNKIIEPIKNNKNEIV